METKIIGKDDLNTAAALIVAGQLVAVPTETVYGLACSGLDADAVEQVYEVKGRPEVKPLSLMLHKGAAVTRYCANVPKQARVLMDKFWPGPLTIVLKSKDIVPDIVRAGGDTVALRCPDHPMTQTMLKKAPLPFAAPSANPSGEKSPVTAQEVLGYFDGKIAAVVDGGKCGLGKESTIIDMSAAPYKILRRGALPEEEIADAASSELADIRRHMRIQSAKVKDSLQKIISSPSYAKALQEPIITMRSERYVVPVKAEHKGAVPGLVHDVSASGATLFIEPMAAVKANNELRELRAREKTEIERILAELSAECAAHREDISSDFDVLVRLDLIFAKAKLAYQLDAIAPELTDKHLQLRRARHPLLPKDTAVPIDVALGGEFDTLVITGPNTGGKTVTLKTIGLLAAMTQCGLHIPCADGSAMPVFDEIMADIGDEQSIEQSLSTFSAHMTNTVRMLKECDDRSLLLFDELGAGTDPTEGAALAIAIIEHARKCGALIAATTHYTELKVYATTQPGVMNASCEFDVDSLRPTYHLLIGIPGKSNAFAISERLGLPEEIIRDARSRVSTESASMEATIEKLEQVRQLMERDRAEAARQLREAEENRRKSERLKAELSVRLEKADERPSAFWLRPSPSRTTRSASSTRCARWKKRTPTTTAPTTRAPPCAAS